MEFGGLGAEAPAQIGLELLDRPASVLVLEFLELRIAGLGLGVPLVRKIAGRDVRSELTHCGRNVQVVE